MGVAVSAFSAAANSTKTAENTADVPIENPIFRARSIKASGERWVMTAATAIGSRKAAHSYLKGARSAGTARMAGRASARIITSLFATGENEKRHFGTSRAAAKMRTSNTFLSYVNRARAATAVHGFAFFSNYFKKSKI